MLKHLVDNLIAIIPFIIGWYIGTKLRKQPDNNKTYYHKCLYCKHYCVRGKSNYSSIVKGYCMHEDNIDVSPLDPVPADYYCGKYEITESYSKELFRIQSEKMYRKNIKEPKIENKK